MITNPTQVITTNYGPLLIKMKDKFVNLNSTIECINTSRKIHDPMARPTEVHDVVRSSSFIDMVLALEIRLGLRQIGDYSGVNQHIGKDGYSKGRYGAISSTLVNAVRGSGTWVHPFLAIDVAASKDKHFAIEMYMLLTESPIFQHRNDSDDLYKELTAAMINAFGNSGYIQAKLRFVARVIAARCQVTIRTDNTTWNYATAEQLAARIELSKLAVYSAFFYANKQDGFDNFIQHIASANIMGGYQLPIVDIAEITKNEVAYIQTAENILGMAA